MTKIAKMTKIAHRSNKSSACPQILSCYLLEKKLAGKRIRLGNTFPRIVIEVLRNIKKGGKSNGFYNCDNGSIWLVGLISRGQDAL